MLAAGLRMHGRNICLAASAVRWWCVVSFGAPRRRVAISSLYLLHAIAQMKRCNAAEIARLWREYPEYRTFLGGHW